MPPDDVLAIDLGGTQMRAALVSKDGSVFRRSGRPTPLGDQDLDSLFELADEVVTGDVSTAVVAVPGRVDYRLGRLEHAPNLPDRWTGLLGQDHLENQLGLEVALANDADVAAVGEAYFGAGRHFEDVAYITVSTGERRRASPTAQRSFAVGSSSLTHSSWRRLSTTRRSRVY